MSNDELRQRADRRFEEALARTGGRDPRDYYRERLRALRARDPDAFARAVEHFESRLIPTVARDDSEPLAEWLEYGRLLAALTCEGETVQIDPSGRATPYAPPVESDRLVLHLPASTREEVIAVGIPASLSPAQRATFSLLVERKTG